MRDESSGRESESSKHDSGANEPLGLCVKRLGHCSFKIGKVGFCDHLILNAIQLSFDAC